MALSTATREWFSKNNLDGFLQIVDAPPHEEPEKVAPTIDLEEITEGTIQALTGLPPGELRSRKAYQTQGCEDPLFREVTHVLLEYVFVHSRPPAIQKYRAGFVIAAYEGLKVDWVTIITECLKSAIASLVEGKKSWTGLAQWLTLLVPPVPPSNQRNGVDRR